MSALTLLHRLFKTAAMQKIARRGDTLLCRDDVLKKLAELHGRRGKPRCS